MKRKILIPFFVIAVVVGALGDAGAVSTYLNNFTTTYPAAASTQLNSCSLCHAASGPPALNSYGDDFQGAGHNFKNAETLDSDGDTFDNLTEINAGTFPGDASSHPAPAPQACTYTYSDWSECQPDNTQTRTVLSSSPDGCTGTPVLSQSCTYVPPPDPQECTYTYSDWSECQPDNTQTRTVLSSSPDGCTGTPVLAESCTYVPPPPDPLPQVLPAPTSRSSFNYESVESPVLSPDPSQAKPIGVGPVASGGDTVEVRVDVGPVSEPVDVTLGIYAAHLDDQEAYFLDHKNRLVNGSEAQEERSRFSAARSHEYEQEEENEHDGEHEGSADSSFRPVVFWKTGVTAVDESVFGPIPVSGLPSGIYVVTLTVKSTTDERAYYRWTTHFMVP